MDVSYDLVRNSGSRGRFMVSERWLGGLEIEFRECAV